MSTNIVKQTERSSQPTDRKNTQRTAQHATPTEKDKQMHKHPPKTEANTETNKKQEKDVWRPSTLFKDTKKLPAKQPNNNRNELETSSTSIQHSFFVRMTQTRHEQNTKRHKHQKFFPFSYESRITSPQTGTTNVFESLPTPSSLINPQLNSQTQTFKQNHSKANRSFSSPPQTAPLSLSGEIRAERRAQGLVAVAAQAPQLGHAEAETLEDGRWRKHKSYMWKKKQKNTKDIIYYNM